MNVAGKSKLGQVIDKRRGESTIGRQIVELFGLKLKIFEKIHNLRQSCHHQKIPFRGKTAHKQLEHGRVFHSQIEISVEHRQLVKIGD